MTRATAFHVPAGTRFRRHEHARRHLVAVLAGAMAESVAKETEHLRLNTTRFPESANVWDSLGEALERAGRRAEAIASYRNALERDPAFPSSVRALERLGAGRP